MSLKNGEKMAKKILLLFCLSLLAFSVFGEDNENVYQEFYRNQLADRFTHYRDKKDLTSAEKLIEKVVQDQVSQLAFTHKTFDMDSCNNLCVAKGTSSTRALMKKISSVDLSDETKECQNYCKVMQLEEKAFLKGINASKKVSSDCAASVNPSSRVYSKDTVGGTISPPIRPVVTPK
jgi:hypothetical protein